MAASLPVEAHVWVCIARRFGLLLTLLGCCTLAA
jgi:hypothetical protein